jgi:tetrahydromethanopterin S-methyltransferase subunit A
MFGILREKFESAAGRLCEVLLPIKHEYHIGRGKGVAICTLSSMDLLETIASNTDIMSRILVVGRLLSENKGISTLIRFTINYPDLRYIVVCGKEVKGHKTGQALLSLHKNGVHRDDSRIIGAIGPNPFLTCSQIEIELFRRQTRIYDLTGSEDLEVIKAQLSLLCR